MPYNVAATSGNAMPAGMPPICAPYRSIDTAQSFRVYRQVPTENCVHDWNVVSSYISVANTH